MPGRQVKITAYSAMVVALLGVFAAKKQLDRSGDGDSHQLAVHMVVLI